MVKKLGFQACVIITVILEIISFSLLIAVTKNPPPETSANYFYLNIFSSSFALFCEKLFRMNEFLLVILVIIVAGVDGNLNIVLRIVLVWKERLWTLYGYRRRLIEFMIEKKIKNKINELCKLKWFYFLI
jgi:hypothetical protein